MEGEFFDPRGEVLIEERLRPHWSQAGAIVFVSFRTKDSIPKHVVEQWDAAKVDWLQSRGWKTEGIHWSQIVRGLPDEERHAFQEAFQRVREACLDQCLGRCLLRRPEIASIVAQTLKHFHGQRYALGMIL
jgi:type I restriction enzyme R subunit